MTRMDADGYLVDRLQDQIDWYEKKAASNQRWFHRLRFTEVLAAASIPFLTGLIEEAGDPVALAVGTIGVALAVIAGVLGLYQFQELWMKYRTSAEMLIHEKFLFLTAAAPYDGGDPFHLLVQRVEGLTSDEHTDWAKLTAGAGGTGE